MVLTRVAVAGEDDDDNTWLTWASSGYVPSWGSSINGVMGVSQKFKV